MFCPMFLKRNIYHFLVFVLKMPILNVIIVEKENHQGNSLQSLALLESAMGLETRLRNHYSTRRQWCRGDARGKVGIWIKPVECVITHLH